MRIYNLRSDKMGYWFDKIDAYFRKITFGISKAIERVEFTILYTAIVGIFILRIWSLNRGLIFTDEAFYYLLLDHEWIYAGSLWNIIYGKLFSSSVIISRAIMFVMQILACGLLSISFKRVFPKIKIIALFAIASITTISPFPTSPNYISLSQFLVYVSLSFFILALYSKKRVFLLVFGFFSFFLLFIIPPNILIVPLLIGSLLLFQSDNKNYLKDVGAVSIGSILAILVFFLHFMTLDEYLEYVHELYNIATNGISGDSSHGVASMLQWVFNTMEFLILYVFFPSFAMYIVSKVRIDKKLKMCAHITLFIFFIGFTFLTYRKAIYTSIASYPIFIVYMISFFNLLENNEYKKSILSLIFLIVSILACLGTDVSFVIRSTAYLAPILLVSYGAVNEGNMIKAKSLLFIIVLTTIIVNVLTINKQGWWGYRLREQSFELDADIINNQSLKLDAGLGSVLAEINQVVSYGDIVFTSDPRCFGYVYLLGLEPAVVDYHFSKKSMETWLVEHKEIEEIYFFEHSFRPFPTGLFSNNTYFSDFRTIYENPSHKIKIIKVSINN